MDIFDNLTNTVDPTLKQEPSQTGAAGTEGQTGTPDNNTAVQTGQTAQTGQANVQQTNAAQSTDTFFDDFNKRYGTSFKDETELKSLFELPKKITEYEGKIKDRDELEKNLNQYKSNLETLKQSEAQKYLEHPLMQKAYIAKQMMEKYPDKDPFILQEIAMSDLSKMDNIEAIAKEKKINFPDLSLEDIKAVVLSDLGIDPTVNPQEWDSLTKAKVAMKGGEAKANIRKLSEGIALPQVETAEQVRQRMDADLAKRTKDAEPHKAEFTKFDKIKIREDLDYTVPDDFKEALNGMFDAFVLQAGNDPSLPENKETLNDIREAAFFSRFKDKIYETMYKDAETKVKAKLEAEVGNTGLPVQNTATASDGAGGVTKKPSHQEFLEDQQNSRVKTLG